MTSAFCCFQQQYVPYSSWYFFPLVLFPIHRWLALLVTDNISIVFFYTKHHKIVYDISKISQFILYRFQPRPRTYTYKLYRRTLRCYKYLYLNICQVLVWPGADIPLTGPGVGCLGAGEGAEAGAEAITSRPGKARGCSINSVVKTQSMKLIFKK